MKSFILSLFAFSFLLGPTLVQAETANCFDYYKFQSVQVSVGPDQAVASAGDTMLFTGEIVNQNSYPVVDGSVFVRIGKRNPNYKTEGQWIVDEFIAVDKIYLAANEAKPISFTWTAPKGLESRNYRADYFFVVGEKFNLGGLPFTNEVVVGFADFTITSNKQTGIFFDKKKTLINERRYNHIGSWPEVSAGEAVVIKQDLKNTNNVKREITVEYDLFYWDSLNPTDKVSSKVEKVTIGANAVQTLTYTIPKMDETVYYLRITATSVEGEKSIVNIRILSPQERPRLNYVAVDKFPLKAGEDFSLFACFHNTSGRETNGRVEVNLTDKTGNSVGQIEYSNSIASMVMGEVFKAKAPTDLDYLNLSAAIYNSNGEQVDEYKTVYTMRSDNQSNKDSYILWAILLISIILLVVTGKVVVKKSSKITITILLSIITLLAAGTLIAKYTLETEATIIVSADGKTKSETNSYSYQIGWEKNATLTNPAAFAIGTISNTNSVTLTGNTALATGETVSFAKSNEGSFNSTGGAYGTPYLGSIESGSGTCLKDGQAVTCASELKWSLPTAPTMSLSSSDTNVLTCSGTTCTAVGSGVATVTATVASVVTNYQASYRNVDGDWYCNYAGTVLNHSSITCGQSGQYGGYTWHVISLSKDNGTTWSSTDTARTLAGFAPTWTFTVTAPALAATCTVSPSTTTTGQNVTWTANATGGTGTYTYSWSGDDGLSGTSQSVTKSYSSYGTKHGQVTVTSGGSSVTSSNCSNSVGGGGGGSTGVSISSSTVNGVCDTTANLCIAGTPQDVTDTSTNYLWSCLGQNGGTDASCSQTIPSFTGSFDCSVVGAGGEINGKVEVNKNTTWSIEPAISTSYERTWIITGGADSGSVNNYSNTLNKIFTTIGLKSVGVSFTVGTSTYTCSNNTAATTSVVLPGSLNEI